MNNKQSKSQTSSNIVHLIKVLTTNSCCKSLNLAPKWTENHVSEGKAVEAGEGAHSGDEEVRYGQVHQDVVQVRAELLVLNSACDSDGVDACTSHKEEEHEC